jgi:signal transduction histidine kinase
MAPGSQARVWSLVDRLVPRAVLVRGSDEVRLARLTVALGASLALFGFVFTWVAAALGKTVATICVAASAIVCVLALVFFRRTGDQRKAAHAIVLGLVLALVEASAETGDILSAVLPWLVAVPVLSRMLLPKRDSLAWTAVAMTSIVAFFVLKALGVHISAPPPGLAWPAQVVVELCGLGALLWSLATWYESAKSQMARELESARDVAERARDQARLAHDAARRVLDAIDQGLFAISEDGSIDAECSAAARQWFGDPPAGARVWDWLAPRDPKTAQWIEFAWAALQEGVLPREVALSQLPTRLISANRTYAVRWLDGGSAPGVLVVASDVTDALVVERTEREQRDMMVALQRLYDDRSAFLEFLDEIDRLIATLVEGGELAAEARALHTLKGNSALFGFTLLAELCHALETRRLEQGEPLSASDRSELSDDWAKIKRRLVPFLGSRSADAVEVPRREIDAVLAILADAPSQSDVEYRIRRWTFEPARLRLERLAEQARRLARRLDKGDIGVDLSDGGVLIAPHALTSFWSSLGHILRNAIDHGLEFADQRALAGKPSPARLRLETFLSDGEFVVVVEDDGRGIHWDRIAEKAKELGLPCTSRSDLVDAMFKSGVSTAEAVTEISGRGVGAGAARAETERLGGRVLVDSEAGRGTRFEFRFPAGITGAPSIAARAA